MKTRDAAPESRMTVEDAILMCDGPSDVFSAREWWEAAILLANKVQELREHLAFFVPDPSKRFPEDVPR